MADRRGEFFDDSQGHGPVEPVALHPKGRASLEGQLGRVTIRVDAVLAEPRRIDVDEIAAVVWWSESGTAFTSATVEAAEAIGDDSQWVLQHGAGDPNARIRFRAPQAMPFGGRKVAWARPVVTWRPRNRYDFPNASARRGMATSFTMRAVDDPIPLKRAFERAGLTFPEYGAPPGPPTR